MTSDVFEDARQYLPKYLSPERTQELYDALRQFPDLPSFYLSPRATAEDLLQGDGWRGFIVTDFLEDRKKTVAGMIISNSCDIDISNPRPLTRRVLFSPLVPLQQYADRLATTDLAHEQIADVLRDIRKQRVTDIFYLPADAHGLQECIVALDDVHPHPLEHFSQTSRERLFRLNQAAFYVFVVKLSIHFCRLQENVTRFPQG